MPPHWSKPSAKSSWISSRALVARTLRVKLVIDDKQMNHNAMSFDIEAELWAQPLPLRLFLRTAVDLETGSIDVMDQGSKGGS
jgi:type VI secretion system protein ImpF